MTTTPENNAVMSIIADWDTKQAAYDRLNAELLSRNKAALFDALGAASVTAIVVSFDGYGDQKVIDDAVVGTTVYLLVARTPKAAWEPNTSYVNDADGSFRWIAVVLTRKARDAYDFGYKDLEESMGPVEARCPRRLIDAASPLRHPDPAVDGNYAARWRQKCLDQATAKTRRKAELVQGATIRLSCVLDFTDGYKGDRFVVEIVRRHGRNHTYFRAPNGGLYRIRNLDKIGYRVEAVAV